MQPIRPLFNIKTEAIFCKTAIFYFFSAPKSLPRRLRAAYPRRLHGMTRRLQRFSRLVIQLAHQNGYGARTARAPQRFSLKKRLRWRSALPSS